MEFSSIYYILKKLLKKQYFVQDYNLPKGLFWAGIINIFNLIIFALGTKKGPGDKNLPFFTRYLYS